MPWLWTSKTFSRGLLLLTRDVFAHGQLYVSLTRFGARRIDGRAVVLNVVSSSLAQPVYQEFASLQPATAVRRSHSTCYYVKMLKLHVFLESCLVITLQELCVLVQSTCAVLYCSSILSENAVLLLLVICLFCLWWCIICRSQLLVPTSQMDRSRTPAL